MLNPDGDCISTGFSKDRSQLMESSKNQKEKRILVEKKERNVEDFEDGKLRNDGDREASKGPREVVQSAGGHDERVERSTEGSGLFVEEEVLDLEYIPYHLLVKKVKEYALRDSEI